MKRSFLRGHSTGPVMFNSRRRWVKVVVMGETFIALKFEAKTPTKGLTALGA